MLLSWKTLYTIYKILHSLGQVKFIYDCSIRVCWYFKLFLLYIYRYQLIVMISDNITESQQWGVNSLDEALTNQVTYVYITAEFNDTTPLNTIELGDGKFYGSYLNKPLLTSLCYRVAIRIVFSKVRSCKYHKTRGVFPQYLNLFQKIILLDCFIRNSCNTLGKWITSYIQWVICWPLVFKWVITLLVCDHESPCRAISSSIRYHSRCQEVYSWQSHWNINWSDCLFVTAGFWWLGNTTDMSEETWIILHWQVSTQTNKTTISFTTHFHTGSSKVLHCGM